MTNKKNNTATPTAASKTRITILGETLDIKFNMLVELNYEELTEGEAFSIEALSKMKNSIALYMAAILAANPDTNITVDRLLKEATGPEIASLSNAVITSMTNWMKIPSVIKEEQPDADSEDDHEKPKN